MTEIAKAGWLMRECNQHYCILNHIIRFFFTLLKSLINKYLLILFVATILKRWKKAWFSLSVDGLLRYFESPDALVAKRTINVSKDVIEIKTGVEIANEHRAPEGLSSEYLIKLVTRDDGSWILCADSVDDML
jgi:hypothetical protein